MIDMILGSRRFHESIQRVFESIMIYSIKLLVAIF